ncbi:MAG: LpqB family beta-propeller domain-containing protein, partial [Pirellulales bacterium]
MPSKHTIARAIHSALVLLIAAAMPASLLAQTKTLEVQKPRGKGSYDEINRFTDHTGAANALALAPDGRHLASAGVDRTIHIIDGKSWKSVRKLAVDADVKDLAFTRTGELVVAGDKSPKYGNCVYVWQWNTNKVLGTWNDATSGVVAVAISPDGKLVAAVEGDGRTRLMSRDHNATIEVEAAHPTYRRTS